MTNMMKGKAELERVAQDIIRRIYLVGDDTDRLIDRIYDAVERLPYTEVGTEDRILLLQEIARDAILGITKGQ